MSDSPAKSVSLRAPSSGWLIAIFAGMLVTALWLLTRAWHASILDRYEFRQLQTAVSAYWMKVDGYRLDYEFPIFGPPWSAPLEFPIYQWVVATVSRILGTGLEPTARGVSVAFFLATLPAVYGLAGLLGLAPSRRLLVVSAVLASPTYLFYGRTFMIETTALCFSTWFLYTTVRAVRDDRWLLAGLAVGFALLAGLTKITTFAVFLSPAALLIWPHWRSGWIARARSPAAFRRATLFAVVPVLLGIATALWWVRHGNGVKATNPFSGFLTSQAMAQNNVGTWSQRFSVEYWRQHWGNISQMVLGEAPIALLLFCAALVPSSFRRVAACSAVFFLSGPLLFPALYFTHDYYYCANAVFVLAGAGFLLAGIWDAPHLPRIARLLAVVVFLGGQLLLFNRSYAGYAQRVLPAPPGIAAVIRETVPADGVVLVYGWDWNTLVPYYAQRRVVMVPLGRAPETKVLDEVLARLPPGSIKAMLIRNDENLRATPDFIRERTNRFNLVSVPVATSADGDLYLAEDRIPDVLARVRGRTFAGVIFNAPPSTADPDEILLREVDAAALALPLLSPHPVRVRGRYGVSAGLSDGRATVMANATSELEFIPPAGATQIEAEMGLVDASYAKGGADGTDGISVEIYELQPNGLRHMLYHRDLDPAHNPADRGPQAISLRQEGPFTSRLIFRITPGLHGNYTNDWAYWSRITIR